MIQKALPFILASATLLGAQAASAAELAGRADLNALLGANLKLEDFEKKSYISQIRVNGGYLDSTTNVPSIGTGTVDPGLIFQRDPSTFGAPRPLYWNPNAYFDISSQSLSGAGASYSDIRADLQILFAVPTTAFGLDLLAYRGFAANSTASVYDRSGNLLGTRRVSGSTVSGTFFGWENAAGIGKVVFSNTPVQNYTSIDNIGFGAAPVPEPETYAMFLAGLGTLAAALRRGGKPA